MSAADGTDMLVANLLSASMGQNFATMDRLYEGERMRRQALEVLVDEVLFKLERAHMGSAREYEDAVHPLRMGYMHREEELAARHHENDGS